MEPVHLPTIKIKNDKKKETKIIDLYQINLISLRKIINISSSKSTKLKKTDLEKWETILAKLLNYLCKNEEIGNETILLASHAYLSLCRAIYKPDDFENILTGYFDLKTNQIIDFKCIFLVYNVELFKLIICHGFLQMGNYNDNFEIYNKILQIVFNDCIRYTRYTHLAFKLAQFWMQRTTKIENFWFSSFTTTYEEKLEAIIFSNWDNAICKSNVVGLFSSYLIVMKKKYQDFLPYLFNSCVEKISWCHVNKYIILTEICNASDDVQSMIDSKFISNLFNSLTINHLSNASTKLYNVICEKLSPNSWKIIFGEHFKNYVVTWEIEKKYNSLQLLCKCWIEPFIKNNRDDSTMTYLNDFCNNDETCPLYESHLLRVAKKYGINYRLKKFNELDLLNHANEYVRLNAFAAQCYSFDVSSLKAIENFLYYNCTTTSTYLREGILNYFKVLVLNLIKRAYCTNDRVVLEKNTIIDFFVWLHKFFQDCFEIGSCYQRKIIGLQLYKIFLEFLQSDLKNCNGRSFISKDSNIQKIVSNYGSKLQKEMKDREKWHFNDKESIVLLFKLVLDSASDVRRCAASLIVNYYDPNVIDEADKIILLKIALEKCNSQKFYDTESGACLFKTLTDWLPMNQIFIEKLKTSNVITGQFETLKITDNDFCQFYAKFLLNESRRQFMLVKKDIFKALTQNSPFYGVINALLLICFDNNGYKSKNMSIDFLEEILNLAENAINFFLNAFSSESTSLDYSSSFQEMGLAIDKAIKNSEINYEFNELILSPGQQTIITCIWRSLKILCELAVALAKSEKATDSLIFRASNTIVSVSIKCRHKGAIESAGMAMADLTRYLTKRQKNCELLENHLKKLLNNDFSIGINLTRRGAGLTILFHKIVVNDLRNERPLLHLAVKSLIKTLGKQLTTAKRNEKIGFNDNCDDPCAIQLHYLKSLVADKQLQAQLSPYFEQICLMCFEYVTSPIFVVRNASYQLFGSLVQRLVSQNSGARKLDYGYGYSINYFATHFPRLAAHVLLNLQQACTINVDRTNNLLQRTTSCIHVLSMLSKLFYSDCELIDGSVFNYVKQIKNCLLLLLADPVAQVRSLAAKCYAASCGLIDLNLEIQYLLEKTLNSGGVETDCNFNRLNGYLMALERLHEKLNEELESTSFRHAKIQSPDQVRKNLKLRDETNVIWNYWCRRSAKIEKNKLCYAVEAQLLRLSREFKIIIVKDNGVGDVNFLKNFSKLFDETKPGFFDFVDELMRLFVKNLTYRSDENYSIVHESLVGKKKFIDFGICFLKHANQRDRNLLVAIVDVVNKHFNECHLLSLEEINVYVNETIRSMNKLQLTELRFNDVKKLKIFAEKLENMYAISGTRRTMQLSELFLYVRVLSIDKTDSYDLFQELMIKNDLIDYFEDSEIKRQLVSKALGILLYDFGSFGVKSKAVLLSVALILLKDEVDVIRETVRDSLIDNVILELGLSKINVAEELVCFILLLNLDDESLLGKLSYDDFLKFFKNYFSFMKHRARNDDATDIENPFDDENLTSFKEDSKLINFCIFCVKQKNSKRILKNIDSHESIIYKNISDIVYDTVKTDLTKEMNIDFCDLRTVLDIKYDAYLAKKLQLVHKVYFLD